MICLECNIEKPENDFYFRDGGLGFVEEKLNICKLCIAKYNQTRKPTMYYDGQVEAQYHGAKLVIDGASLLDVVNSIDNGITTTSNRMGIQNFLYLMDQSGLAGVSRQKIRIFENLKENT